MIEKRHSHQLADLGVRIFLTWLDYMLVVGAVMFGAWLAKVI